ncbi:MAG: 3-oxoacyl-ACP reductase, partial [Clostridia bacterium]|nr:3-oxoacyl-ACP reductase [Clostridia bacterium]
PGETATEILHQEEGVPFKMNSPRGERAMPMEIAEEIFFLATRKNIIGEVLVSDGGRSLY